MGVMEVFCPDVETITWITRDGIRIALIEHWAKDGDNEGVRTRVEAAYAKNGYVKLINGEKAYKLKYPYSDLLERSIDIIIKKLKPDIWTEKHENDFPDYLRVPKFGIYDWRKLQAVSEEFGIRSIIRAKDQPVLELNL